MAKYTEWVTEEGLIKIGGWAKDGLTDEQIAQNIGISRSTLNEWKKRFPDIKDTIKRGKEVVDRQVENALFKSAIGYEYTEITKERMADNGQKKRHNGESSLTEEEWETALAYFNYRCAYCGDSDEMTKDHLDPLKNGGELTFSNVVPACRSCNSSKKDHQWLSWYQNQYFYDKYKANKITDYISFVLSLPKKEENTELVVTKEVTKQVAPNPTSAIFWLKNRKPDVWRDKKQTEVSGEMSVNNPFAGLSEEELRKLAEGDG